MKIYYIIVIIITYIEHTIAQNPTMESQKIVCTCMQNSNNIHLLTEASKVWQLVSVAFTELKEKDSLETNTRLNKLLAEYDEFIRKLYNSESHFHTCTTKEEYYDFEDVYFAEGYVGNDNSKTKYPFLDFSEKLFKHTFRCEADEARTHYGDLYNEIKEYLETLYSCHDDFDDFY